MQKPQLMRGVDYSTGAHYVEVIQNRQVLFREDFSGDDAKEQVADRYDDILRFPKKYLK